ncbi:MAG: hypothetical protein HZB39_09455 [Planctomycetes bacterium]|nr:hypothetical protein [Planctomycetota bacterium]
MKRFTILLATLLLAGLAAAQTPQLQSFEDIGTYSADAVIDLSFSGQTNDGGETGGRHPRRHCRPGYRRHHNGCNTCRRPEPRCIDIRCLPIVTDECFTISGRCLDLIDEVRFGSRVLAEGGTLGDGGWAVSEDGRELEVCPPQCLRAGCYVISLKRRGCVVARFGVNLFEPRRPAIACDEELSVGETQCIYVHDGGQARPNRMFILISPDNTPSVIPGLVELGLGNNFTNYYCGVALDGPCAVECIGIVPPDFVGFRLYFQMVVLNTSGQFLPLPVTEVCSTRYVR